MDAIIITILQIHGKLSGKLALAMSQLPAKLGYEVWESDSRNHSLHQDTVPSSLTRISEVFRNSPAQGLRAPILDCLSQVLVSLFIK